MKFIHITDFHLAAPGQGLWGLDPQDRVSRCFDDIARWQAGVDFASRIMIALTRDATAPAALARADAFADGLGHSLADEKLTPAYLAEMIKLPQESDIAQAIAEHSEAHRERADEERERVIAELRRIAYADADELRDWPQGRLADKLKALEQICRMHGWHLDKTQVTTGDGDVVFVLPSNGSEVG